MFPQKASGQEDGKQSLVHQAAVRQVRYLHTSCPVIQVLGQMKQDVSFDVDASKLYIRKDYL